MRIVSLQVNARQLNISECDQKVFTFSEGVNIVFSVKNSVGKTTLLRLLLYALGYRIPNTRGIDFYNYECVLTVIRDDGSTYLLTRNRDYIEVLHDGVEKGYSLPIEQNDLHATLFGISNLDVLDNMLGAFYLDQEKGWTLLNRGKVIGKIQFSLESLLRGLSNRSNVELLQRLAAVKREIKKYKHMIDVAAYRAEINQLGEMAFIDSPVDDIENALEVLYCERKPIEDELCRIRSLIRKNTSFEKFITSFRLRVKDPISGNEVPVNKDTLIGYRDTADLLVARQGVYYEYLSTIDRKIATHKSQLNDEAVLVKVTTSLQKFDADIARITVDAVATKRILGKLEMERQKLEATSAIKQDNPLVGELHQLVSAYTARLGLDEKYVSTSINYIFTRDLKSLSGAIFHKIVFAFKVAYVKLIQKHTGVFLPIILDSPRGREVSMKNINEMMAILAEDFRDHQIIIASIYNKYPFPGKNTIEISDRLLPF